MIPPSRVALAGIAETTGWSDVASALLAAGPFYRQLVDTVWPQSPEVERALAFLEEGKGYPLDHPPSYYVDFGGAAWSGVLVDDTLHVSITAPPLDRSTRAAGFSFASVHSAVVHRFGGDAANLALLLFVERNRPEIVAHYVAEFQEAGSLSRGFSAAGLDSNEFVVAGVTLQMAFGDSVVSTRFDSWLPVQIHVQASLAAKPVVFATPLRALSDRALDALIDTYNSLLDMSDSGGAFPGSKAWRQAKVYSDQLAALVAAHPGIEAYRAKLAADRSAARLAGKDIMGM